MAPERKAEYVAYMKRQLKELIDQCDVEVLWFDGEWPDWWTEPDGQDLYTYLRALKPRLVINNRIGKGRKGMEGLSKRRRSSMRAISARPSSRSRPRDCRAWIGNRA